MEAMLGREVEAIATLETYLAKPGARSFRNVATHPLVEPLRGHPDFRQLEQRFSRTEDGEAGP